MPDGSYETAVRAPMMPSNDNVYGAWKWQPLWGSSEIVSFLKIDWYIVKCVAAEQPHTVQHTKTLLFLNVGTLKIMIGEKNMP